MVSLTVLCTGRKLTGMGWKVGRGRKDVKGSTNCQCSAYDSRAVALVGVWKRRITSDKVEGSRAKRCKQ